MSVHNTPVPSRIDRLRAIFNALDTVMKDDLEFDEALKHKGYNTGLHQLFGEVVNDKRGENGFFEVILPAIQIAFMDRVKKAEHDKNLALQAREQLNRTHGLNEHNFGSGFDEISSQTNLAAAMTTIVTDGNKVLSHIKALLTPEPAPAPTQTDNKVVYLADWRPRP